MDHDKAIENAIALGAEAIELDKRAKLLGKQPDELIPIPRGERTEESSLSRNRIMVSDSPSNPSTEKPVWWFPFSISARGSH